LASPSVETPNQLELENQYMVSTSRFLESILRFPQRHCKFRRKTFGVELHFPICFLLLWLLDSMSPNKVQHVLEAAVKSPSTTTKLPTPLALCILAVRFDTGQGCRYLTVVPTNERWSS